MKKAQKKTIEPDNERREFIKKSTKMAGAYGFALYELVEELKSEMDGIVQEFVEDIKKEIKKP